MKKLSLAFILALLLSISSFSQRSLKGYEAIDIQSYEFHISVNDSSNTIHANAKIDILFNSNANSFKLDLAHKDATAKGMIVSKITHNGNSINFIHENNTLEIFDNFSKGHKKVYSINYHGVPKDGLIISNNKYGDRTFFGDNWPDRAHQWLPSVDHPSDKAFVEWHITAPSHYQAIANGALIEETNLSNNNTKYVWKTNVPLSTKVMVIGVAKFAVQQVGETHNIPISSWVYPQNKEAGFYDYAIAKNIINFFIENIGPYPYAKLANVQSKTRYGGMENAGNIFYYENSINGKRTSENLIAHEIAHQWFGNSATETDWPQIWLSEGFATYFTNLYIENEKGANAFKKIVNKQRKQVIDFSKKQLTPILDFNPENLMALLNPNSYQKGGWILHMLRYKVGDDNFWKGIKKYYEIYAFKNASTRDLKKVFEDVTGEKLDTFFSQWLEKPGHPILKTSWKWSERSLTIKITQTQQSDVVFKFPIEIRLIYKDNSSEIITLDINDRTTSAKIRVKSEIKDIVIDPNSWLLFEEHKD